MSNIVQQCAMSLTIIVSKTDTSGTLIMIIFLLYTYQLLWFEQFIFISQVIFVTFLPYIALLISFYNP